jgi:hypothetical protein
MHFNIYLDDALGQQLTAEAQRTGASRNALIRKAIGEWLARRAQPQWPEVVMAFNGQPDMPAFEASRAQLTAPADDPLA